MTRNRSISLKFDGKSHRAVTAANIGRQITLHPHLTTTTPNVVWTLTEFSDERIGFSADSETLTGPVKTVMGPSVSVAASYTGLWVPQAGAWPVYAPEYMIIAANFASAGMAITPFP